MHADDSGTDAATAGPTPACGFSWCTTDHGATLHPDDEEHRSAGVAVPVVYRRGAMRSTERQTTVEIGLVQRASDLQVWLVLDDGADVDLQIPAELAHQVVAALRSDPHLGAELGLCR